MFTSETLECTVVLSTLGTITTERMFLVVKVSDAVGCFACDTVEVRTLPGVTYCLPNSFSPNGDGFNDLFRVIQVGIATTDYFRIFNRYGETVFLTTDIRKGWDGTYKVVPQPVGNYVCLVKGLCGNGNIVEMRGKVVLIR